MSDSFFNRPRRQIEPRMSDDRGRDFRDQSDTPDHGATERPDPGADAMSELARMISETDPVAPVPGRVDDAHKSGGRLADISRNMSSDRGVRREPDFGVQRLPVDADHAETSHGSDRFDFRRLPERDDYAVAPRHALTDEEDHYRHDDRELTRRQSGYGRHNEQYADEYHEDEYRQDEDREYGDGSGDGETGVKRRSTTKVAVAVVALAVLGSAAAFGYRTIFKAAPSGPTPFIRADNSPTKVAPAGTEAIAKPANGPIGDR